MTRHVAYVEPRGLLRSRSRRRRQEEILAALSESYRSLPDEDLAPSSRRPGRAFAFPTSTRGTEAKAHLARLLDDIDPDWRKMLKIFDGFAG